MGSPGKGWIIYSSIMLLLLGVKLILDGLWALDRSDTVVDDLLANNDLGTWGWVWLISGAVVFAAGIGVFLRQRWAQVVGIGAAVIAAFMNLASLYAYPIGSLVGVLLAVLVIYGLAAYGEEEFQV